jgi:hypothetical protein
MTWPMDLLHGLILHCNEEGYKKDEIGEKKKITKPKQGFLTLISTAQRKKKVIN